MPDTGELKQVEEYRVVGEDRDGARGVGPLHSLSHARARASSIASPASSLVRPWTNIRIQSRTVTTSPWKDVPDE